MQGLSQRSEVYQGNGRMPPVREIDLSDGIRIKTSDGRTVQIQATNIAVLPGNLAKKEERLNKLLQQQYESRHLLSEYDPDHRVRQATPNLHVWERIEGGDLVVTLMWVAVHIYSLSPLKLTSKCQNREFGSIGGDWWV